MKTSMARGAVEELGWRIPKWLSYKTVCSLNLVAIVIFLLSSLANPNPNSSGAKYTGDQIRRVEESVRVRHAAKAVENLIKILREEFDGMEEKWGLSGSVKLEAAKEILERLKELSANAGEIRGSTARYFHFCQ